MSKWDKEYIKLCKKILKEGYEVENRTGINTIKIPAYQFELDVGKEFPILTTKQVFIRQAVLEMMWIYQAQSNDVRWLKERNVNIWNEWEIDEDGIYRIYEPTGEFVDKEVVVKDLDGNDMKDEFGNIMKAKSNLEGKTIKAAKFYGKEYAHTIGTAYGYIVNNFKLIDNLIDTIKNNPTDRRMLMSLWQNDYLKTAVLPSCVWSNEWDVTNGKLNLWVHQRSCDVPLGLPFNVSQYATLLMMIAQVTNLEPGTLNWSIKDAHIYVNQIDGIKEQIKRYDELGDFKAPKVWLNPDIKNFYEFDNSKECKDIKVLEYQNHGPIRFPIAQ